jgi:hypothetical protein
VHNTVAENGSPAKVLIQVQGVPVRGDFGIPENLLFRKGFPEFSLVADRQCIVHMLILPGRVSQFLSSLKPISQWVPSQNGLFFELPQRQTPVTKYGPSFDTLTMGSRSWSRYSFPSTE